VPWTAVRIFGNLTYFNISYGVLLLVPILHELYVRAVPIMGWFGAPGEFPVTLQWLYAASLIYAIAILTYQICCPLVIKRNASPADYVRSEYEIFQRADPQHRINIILARLRSDDDRGHREKIEQLYRLASTAEIAADRTTAQIELDALLAQLHGHAVQQWLLDEYDDENLRWPLARWFSFGFYIFGCAILGLLLVIRSIEVFRDYREGNMLIQTEMSADHGRLHLLAYTFQEREFQILETVLRRAEIGSRFSAIEPDRSGREGRRYYVPAPQISTFERAVSGSFDPNDGAFTAGSPAPGRTYACKEKRMGGRDGSGCQEFTATDEPAAFVACSLIAGRNHWYFGVSQPGTCGSRKRSWLPW
jgi:hypothetical protein